MPAIFFAASISLKFITQAPTGTKYLAIALGLSSIIQVIYHFFEFGWLITIKLAIGTSYQFKVFITDIINIFN